MLRELFDKYDCDKGYRHGYERVYEPLFEPIRLERLRILEVGIYKGASLATWLDYFPNADITGIDTFPRIKPNAIPILSNPRISYISGDSRLVHLEERFDIIIDDGDHSHRAQRETLCNLIDNAKRLYLIEDVWALHLMTQKQRKHPWLKHKGYSPVESYKLHSKVDELEGKYHDLRAGYEPNSCLVEIRL